MILQQLIVTTTIIVAFLQLLILTVATRQPDHASNRSRTNKSANRRHCDIEICDSIVNDCTRDQKCSCDFKRDASCARQCLDCLGDKFGKCCACVDLCPALRQNTRHSSHVGDLEGSGYEELFEVLTETEDIHKRWTTHTGKAGKEFEDPEFGHLEMAYDDRNELVLSNKLQGHSSDENEEENQTDKPKCVVAYINKQLDMSQCKRYCRSMGASSYRWFHEGCCECVGKFCIHYGIDRPKCPIDDD